METNNLAHLTFSHHSYKNKTRYEHRVGWMFLSYSHPHPARLSFPGLYQHISNASEMLIRQHHSCELLHRRERRHKTKPSHLCVEPKPDFYSRHPQLFSTKRKNSADSTASVKVAVLFLWPNLAADWKVPQKQQVDRVFKSSLVRWSWFSSNITFLVSILLYLLKESLNNSQYV